MQVILEGPDGVGKSTLAEFLKNKYTLTILHSSNKTENTYEYHKKLIEDEDIVLDRANLGEVVYPAIYNRIPKMSWPEQLDFMDDFDGIYIIMYASNFDDLKERLFSRGDTEEVLENAKAINALYKVLADILSTHYGNVFPLDISKEKDQIEYFERVILFDYTFGE